MSTVRTAITPAPSETVLRARLAGLVLGVAALLGYLPGRGRSLDFDSAETVGLFVRKGPPWVVFREQAVFNNHPMFSFLEQMVRVLTGRSDAATMRLLPIACGALTIGVLTWFTTRRHGLLAGVVAGAVLACNPTFTSLSRSVRGYSLLTLCAVVTTIIVAEDGRERSRLWGAVYVAAAGVGLATHLYMVPVIVAQVGAVLARRQLDDRWRRRFLGVVLVAACAYAGMAATMVQATAAHARIFKVGLPWRVATMATGGAWAALALGPLVVVGAVSLLRGSPGARGAAIALATVLFGLWAVMQSSAIEERFFVWLVPGAAYLAGRAVAKFRGTSVLAAGSAVIALTTLLPRYTDDPTAYRQAAAVLRQIHAEGGVGCVVDVGVPPMQAYLDEPGDFRAVTDPSQLDGCEVVVVAAWWPGTAPWFARDRQVIDAAEGRFPHRLVLSAGDPALVLSRGPVAAPAE